MWWRIARAVLVAALISSAGRADADPSDLVLVNGRITQFDGPHARALAIRGGHIFAVGTNAEVRRRAGAQARVVDLGGRTVIPGIIDSHIHAIRAGLTWQTEVNWIGARSIGEALDRLRAAAARTGPDDWLIVAGGWVERQFAEGRRPTLAEIGLAVPGRAVYVQLLYNAVLLTDRAKDRLGEPAGLEPETDAAGATTGWYTGTPLAVTALYDRLPRPDRAQQVAGTTAFFRELAALGVTGVLDPGGYNLPPDAYGALHQVWREQALAVRVWYSLSAPRRGTEPEDFAALTKLLPMGMGDDRLRFNGVGENVTWDMYNNDAPSDAHKTHLLATLRQVRARGFSATFHWHNDRSVHHLLDVLETLDREQPIAPLRWSIAHLNDASSTSLARMQALGVGWLVQNALHFRGASFLAQRGTEEAGRSPPVREALRRGIPIGGGTDAHRVMHYNPFVALQWMLDGRTVDGLALRAPEHLLSRRDALRIYTLGSAWFAHDDHRRGALTPGRLADLAVLDRDYFTVPVADVGKLRALLTLVGGDVTHASGAFAALARPASTRARSPLPPPSGPTPRAGG